MRFDMLALLDQQPSAQTEQSLIKHTLYNHCVCTPITNPTLKTIPFTNSMLIYCIINQKMLERTSLCRSAMTYCSSNTNRSQRSLQFRRRTCRICELANHCRPTFFSHDLEMFCIYYEPVPRSMPFWIHFEQQTIIISALLHPIKYIN